MKQRAMEQIRESRNRTGICSLLIFDNVPITIQWKKESLLNFGAKTIELPIQGAGKELIHIHIYINLNYYVTLTQKNYLKWITGLNVKANSLELTE